ncbi:MAG TPA: FKBP-type peptidyl-prolyl cis-trans isomerase [Allosphingosinicella sp.]|nr:FKBP-type peptidyl-prolyl cis-trans isomerase [Allosphingosinicella sp.]
MSVTAVPIRPIRKGSVAKLWVGLLLLALAAIGFAWAGTRGHDWVTTASGLQYQVIEEGEGAKPGPTDVATFDYVGRLQNGTEFDSSEGKGPAQIPIFGVVPGFAEGLQLMSKGATYRLRIPPEIGYGPEGQPPVIPPNSTIEFEVTLRDFRALTQQEIQQMQMMQMMQQQQMQQQMQGGGAPDGR